MHLKFHRESSSCYKEAFLVDWTIYSDWDVKYGLWVITFVLSASKCTQLALRNMFCITASLCVH